jgi:hypothetical protein
MNVGYPGAPVLPIAGATRRSAPTNVGYASRRIVCDHGDQRRDVEEPRVRATPVLSIACATRRSSTPCRGTLGTRSRSVVHRVRHTAITGATSRNVGSVLTRVLQIACDRSDQQRDIDERRVRATPVLLFVCATRRSASKNPGYVSTPVRLIAHATRRSTTRRRGTPGTRSRSMVHGLSHTAIGDATSRNVGYPVAQRGSSRVPHGDRQRDVYERRVRAHAGAGDRVRNTTTSDATSRNVGYPVAQFGSSRVPHGDQHRDVDGRRVPGRAVWFIAGARRRPAPRT